MAINDSDFSPASVSGTVTVNSSAGTSSTIVAADQETEGPEKFVIKLRTGSITGPIVAVSNPVTINDTSVNNPTYSFQANVASVSEGQSVKFTLVTTDVDNGTNIPYEITGVASADINGASLTGNFTVNNSGTATIDLTITTTADLLTEGNETLTIRLTTAPNNPSVSITIVDSSVAPPVPVAGFQLTNGLFGATPATSTTQNEGATVYFYLSVENAGDLWGTQVPYTITGVSGTDLGNSTDTVLNGYFQLPQTPQANPVADRGFMITSDITTEGTETMVMTLNGKNVSSSVIINDTSLTPVAPPTYNLSFTQTNTGGANRNVAEGGYITYVLVTTNIVPGTSVPFGIFGVQSTDLTGTGLTWTGTRFSGSFVMQNADPSAGLPLNSQTASFRVDVVSDLLTEGTESATLVLDGVTNPGNNAVSINIDLLDTSVTPVTTGSATITAANTRQSPTLLPAAATWLAFRVIGAGGAGGGWDGEGAGGSGGGAQYARGIVKLPATSGPKTIAGFVGRPSRGGTASGRLYDLGGEGENCTPTVNASGAQGEINGPSGSSGEGGGGGGATSLYYQDYGPGAGGGGGAIVPLVVVGGGGGGGGGSHRRSDYGNANTENKGFITFGAGLDRQTAIPGLKAEWCRLDGGGGGGGGGAGGKEGFCGDDNDRGSKGGSAGYVIRNDSDGLTWNTFDWYGIGPVPPSSEGVAPEAPQPFPWATFGRGGTGATSGGTYGHSGQMGAIAVYWTTAVDPPSYSNVPDWAFPAVTIPAGVLANRDMQASNASQVTFYSWGSVSYNIDGNISTDCFIISDWGNDPINGIGEFLEIRVTSAAPSNGLTRGSLSSNITENTWTAMKPMGPFGYYVTSTEYYLDVTVSIRRRDNQAVLRTVTYYNLTQPSSYYDPGSGVF